MAITWDVWYSLPNPLQWCCFPTLYSTKRTGVTSNPFRLRLHSWKGNVSTWTNSPWYSFFWVRFQIPHPTDFEWKSWETSWSWLSRCFYMLLSAASFLFWAPAMMSENLSHCGQLQIYKSQKKQHPNRPQKYEIKTSTYQNISKYYDYIKYYKVLVFLLYSHTHLTHLSWSLANSQASGRTPMSQQGRNAAWISVCRY